MPVRLESTIRRYVGLSTDRKPFVGVNLPDGAGVSATLTALDLPPGSSFLETDTGAIWRWNGMTWMASPIDRVAEDWLALIYLELVKLRELKELS